MTRLLLLTAAIVAAPLVAQETQTAPPADATQTTPMQPAPAETAPPADPAAPPADTAAAPAADGEFTTYDKNADGSLSRSEFGAWMSAHNSAAAAGTKKLSAGSAFSKADADKSRSVSKDELTSYLAQSPS